MVQATVTSGAHDEARDARRTAAILLASALAYIVAAIFSVTFVRQGSLIAAFWLANGILCIGLLLLADVRARILLIALCAAGIVVIRSQSGDPLGMSLIFMALNVSESLIAYFALRLLSQREDLLSSAVSLVPFILVTAFGAPLVPALLAATAFAIAYAAPFWSTMVNWFAAHALGLTLIIPVLLLFKSDKEDEFQFSRVEVAAHFVLLMAATLFVFLQSDYPFLFVVFPLLTFIAFRLGPAFSALAALAVSVVAVATTLTGTGPMGLMGDSTWITKIHVLQLFIAFVFLTTLPVASLLSDRARLIVRLAVRDKEMQVAMELAEAAVRSKSEFLSNMSHELRTPLNSIAGFTQLLLDRTEVDGNVRADIQKIKNASAALNAVVDDILDYTKLEEGRIEIASQPFLLGQVVDNAVSIIGSLASHRDIHIRAELNPSLASRWYVGDSTRLRQILLNLLSNAIKFTEEGGVTVTIEQTTAADGAHALRFTVSDTGIGIDPQQCSRLFQRFSQVDSSPTRKYGGSGLGLAICKQLVTLLGGDIGVESKVGSGSTFWFVVPLVATDAPPEMLQPGDAQSAAEPCHVLVVEDLELNREIAVAMLEHAGHRVDVAENGEEAVKAVAARHYDIVLMDIQMPVMDGLVATRTIRAMAGHAGAVPIIAMTANVLPDEVESFYAAGMNGHIRKPVDRDDILREINRCRGAALQPAGACA